MRVAVVALVIMLAGCIGAPDEPAADASVDSVEDAVQEAVPEAPEPFLVATGCSEGSGVSVYDSLTFAPYGPREPWVLADITQEVGDARIMTLGNVAPVSPVRVSETTGHWHTTVDCNEVAWGWVGIRVEPPTWDEGGADRHVLLALWSLPPNGLMEAAQAKGFPAQETEEAFVNWPDMAGMPSRVYMHQYLDDADHGAYEVQAVMASRASLEERVTRFWMQVPVDGATMNDGPWRPVAFDAHDVRVGDAGFSHQTSMDSTGWFSHTQTTMHLGGGGYGNSAAVAYDDFRRELHWGPAPDVELEYRWHH